MPQATSKDKPFRVSYPLEPELLKRLEKGIKEKRLVNVFESITNKSYLRIDCNPSKMKAYLTCSGAVQLPDIQAAFKEKGIRVGIRKVEIETQLKTKKPFTLMPCAAGQDVVEGKEESLDLVKNEFLHEKYDELDLIYKDDVVAEVIPEKPGIPGKNVFGQRKDPILVQSNPMKLDQTIARLNVDDKITLVAQVNGYLQRTKETLKVIEELVIKDKYNSSMGNIRFNNNIHFKHECEGNYVETTENVTVDEVMTGTSMTCRNLVLHYGINGQKKSHLNIHENMSCNYISESVVRTKETLTVNKYIYWSEVSAHEILGENLKVVGGLIISHSGLDIGSVGSETMTGKATVVVGMNFEDYQVNMVLKKQLKIFEDEQEELLNEMQSGNQYRKDNLKQQLEILKSKIREIENEIERLSPGIEDRDPLAQIHLKKGVKGKVNFIIAGLEHEVQLDQAEALQLKLQGEQISVSKL